LEASLNKEFQEYMEEYRVPPEFSSSYWDCFQAGWKAALHAKLSHNSAMDAIADLNFCLNFSDVPKKVRYLIIRARDVFISLQKHQ
jgi:hypothetical protein